MRRMAIIMAGIYLIAISQGIKYLPERMEHGLCIAEAAPIDKERIAGEKRGVVAHAVYDTVGAVTRRIDALHVLISQRQALMVPQEHIALKGAARMSGNRRIEKYVHLTYARAVVVVAVRQEDISRTKRRKFRNRAPDDTDISAGIDECGLPTLLVQEDVGKIRIQAAYGKLSHIHVRARAAAGVPCR